MTVRVHEIDADLSFQYLLLSDRGRAESFRLEGLPITNWVPPKVFSYKPQLPAGDFWSVELGLGAYAVTPEVAQAAWHLLQSAGQLLPLPYQGREFQLLNVTETVNCLDHQRAEILTDSTSGSFMRIQRYAFHIDRLPESSIFKIPETRRTTVYCSQGLRVGDDDFKGYVEKHRLRGLKFKEVWHSDN